MTARINGGLGARIKEAYLAAGLNQTKLAERLGTTPSIVNGWIKQEVVPEGRFLMLMPEILQCDANWLLRGKEFSGAETPGVDYLVGRLTELLDDVSRGGWHSSRPKPKAQESPPGPETLGPETLKERFLAAIHPYNDLEVERFCGLSHETVRQYKKEWPERGPNKSSIEKMRVMIEIADAMDLQDSIVRDKKLPPRAHGLITIAEGLQEDEEVLEKGPNLGWIAVADGFANSWREMNLMTILDEFAWLGYKRAHHYDPDTASKLTPEDVGLDPKHVAPLGDSMLAGSDG